MSKVAMSTLLSLGIFLFLNRASIAEPLTAQDVIDAVKANVNCEWSENTVDTFKAGDPDVRVTGIATTFTATMDVLKQAVEANCNLIITHEPTFYQHMDDATPLGDDGIVRDKKAFIEKHGLVIWRFHDHIHRHQPDGIYQGMVEFLGWNDYRVEGERNLFRMPELSLAELATQLKQRFGVNTIRVIGDPELKSGKIGFSAGAPGSLSQMKLLQRDDVEILLVGETREWETVEYVRDAAQQGKRKALIILGHSISEEYGMKHCADWMQGFIDESVQVKFIPAGNPFWAP